MQKLVEYCENALSERIEVLATEWPDCPYAGETCAETYARDPASFHGSKPSKGRGCLLPAAGAYCVETYQCLACPVPALAKQRADAVAAAAMLRGTWERSREGTNIEVSWEDWEETVRQALAGLEGDDG
jgi:hypothetical protein